jgi:hypothetical protein
VPAVHVGRVRRVEGLDGGRVQLVCAEEQLRPVGLALVLPYQSLKIRKAKMSTETNIPYTYVCTYLVIKQQLKKTKSTAKKISRVK